MAAQATVLVIDDERQLRSVLSAYLRKKRYKVEVAESGFEALAKMEHAHFDVVLTDLRMPGLDGIEVVKLARQLNPQAKVIMMTGYATVANAVEAMKAGAVDYVSKPFQFQEIIAVIQKALDTAADSEAEPPAPPRTLPSHKSEEKRLIGQSPAMKAVMELAQRVALTNVAVRVEGQSGTGKELLARAIHRHSPRKARAFVAINCAALPEALLENELFGHEDAAFTGATHKKVGLIETAHDGTLFLDEISETSNAFQSKLLRVLQEGELRRLGSTTLTLVDFRLIVATNRDLKQEVDRGRFRADLFYRLDTFVIKMPPVAERKDDLPVLVNYFLDLYDARGVEIHREAMSLLYKYHWPGNVRELENVIQRAILLCSDNVVRAEDLPQEIRQPKRPPVELDDNLSLRKAKERFERQYIEMLLRRTSGNVSRAAEIAKLARAHFHQKIRQYDIAAAKYRDEQGDNGNAP